MMSLIEPSQQLAAAFVIGSCTLCAALVNAIAQLRVARETRRNPKKAEVALPPRPPVRRWVVLGAVLALGLGWSATDRVQAASVSGTRAWLPMLDVGGAGDARGDGDALAVALVQFRDALDDSTVDAFLRRQDVRPYAVDFRFPGEDARWLEVSVATAPEAWAAALRAADVRAALHHACALEALTLANEGADTVGLRLVRTQAGAARERADRLASGEPLVHALRVVGTRASLVALSGDARVARAEVWRWDTGAPAARAAAETAALGNSGCEVVQLDGSGSPVEVSTAGAEATRVNPSGATAES